LEFIVNPTYFIEETHSICAGESYTWHGTDYTEPGTYTAEYECVNTGCDSIYELELIVNPTYLIEESHTMCDGETYTWHGTDYTEQGTYTAEYECVNTGCDSIYALELIVNPTYLIEESHSICEGESYTWHGVDYTASGTYTAEYETVDTGCDSIYELELIVNPLPNSVIVIQSPTDGVLTQGNTGQIALSTSYTGTEYWVTMGGVDFSQPINGTDSYLSLGDYYPAGSFDIWSRNAFGCELLQDNVNFVESTGTNKIVANVTFGTPASNFPSEHARVVLYKEEIDINEEEVIVFVDQQVLTSNGQAEFSDLEPGDYYLGSFIIYPDNYNVSEHVFYQTAVMHEDAVSIPVTSETVFMASLHHPQLIVNAGTNNGIGTVSLQDFKKNLSPIEDMVVVLRDMDADEIIDVSVTNENGEYAFSDIPDNTNIQIFVTSIMHQNWIPYTTQTEDGALYTVNFIVDEDNIYPDGTVGIENAVLPSIEFSIYPNPAENIINIISDCDNAEISIFDINGRLIQKQAMPNNGEINVSYLSPGSYALVLQTKAGEVGVQKFVKVKGNN